MSQITLEQVALAVTFLVGLITGIGQLNKHLKAWIAQSLKNQLDNITVEIKTLHDRIDEVDMETCKNYLVTFLSDVEKGHLIDEIERERFWEQYQHYVKHGGNSYVKHKVEKLQSEGKL